MYWCAAQIMTKTIAHFTKGLSSLYLIQSKNLLILKLLSIFQMFSIHLNPAYPRLKASTDPDQERPNLYEHQIIAISYSILVVTNRHTLRLNFPPSQDRVANQQRIMIYVSLRQCWCQVVFLLISPVFFQQLSLLGFVHLPKCKVHQLSCRQL